MCRSQRNFLSENAIFWMLSICKQKVHHSDFLQDKGLNLLWFFNDFRRQRFCCTASENNGCFIQLRNKNAGLFTCSKSGIKCSIIPADGKIIVRARRFVPNYHYSHRHGQRIHYGVWHLTNRNLTSLFIVHWICLLISKWRTDAPSWVFAPHHSPESSLCAASFLHYIMHVPE